MSYSSEVLADSPFAYWQLDDGAPTPIATASSYYPSETPSNAVDWSSDTRWTTNGTSTGWLRLELPASQVLTSYCIRRRDDIPNRNPKNWTFEGSNDGSTWTTLDTRTNITWPTVGEFATFTFANTTAYLYYRLNVSANNGDGYLSVADIAVGPVGYGFADSSASARHGIRTGSMTPKQAAAAAIPGFALGMSGGYVASPVAMGSTSALTYEAWVKTTTATGTIISSRINNFGMTLQIGSAASGAFGAAGEVSLGLDGGGTYIGVSTTTKRINDGNWHHVVGVWAGSGAVTPSQFTIYIDGVAEALTPRNLAGAATAPITWSDTPLVGYSTNWDTSLIGTLDEVAIYTTALLAARVAAHYDAAIGTGPSPITATVDAVGPAGTAGIQATYSAPPIEGTLHATGPAGAASIEADFPISGTLHAVGPAGTAHISDGSGDVTATVGAVGPAGTAAIGAVAPATHGDPWEADLSGRTLLALVTSGHAQAVPPLAAIPPHIVEHPITRKSRIVPDLRTIAQARIHPETGAITVPDDVYDAFPVVEGIVGVPHLIIDGVDVTYFRGSRTLVGDDRAQEPFGDATLAVSFPQVTTLDDKDDPDLAWMRPDAAVHYVMQHWDETGPSGIVSTLFHGRLVSDDSGNDSSRPQKDWSAQGTLWQAASFQHQVRPIINPADLGTQIPKVLNEVTSRRYPKIANVNTGIPTRERGNSADKVLGYTQGLLGDAWTPEGRQWTVAKKPGTVCTYELRLKKTGSQWTITNGQRGLEVSLSTDSTQSRNVIWGRGQRSDGGVWMNKLFPDSGSKSPAYPFASAGTVMTIGTTDAMTSTGNGVTTWQKRAKVLGFSVTVDGVYNSADAAVCRQLQRQYGILVDGIVGPQTWAETFDVGARGADPDSWVRLPLAADPRTQQLLYRANGSVIGDNPLYDDTVSIVSDEIDFGTDVELATGKSSSQQIIDRENPPSLSGRLILKTDPREDSRWLIPAGDRITLIGYEGRDPVLHIADRSRNRQEGTVTLQVAETAYDALTLAQIRARNNAARADIPRRPGKLKPKPSIDPWDCESKAGKIERHALYPGLWTVIRVPMSELGRLAYIDLRTSSPARFAWYLFAHEITSAQMIRHVGARPLDLDSPGETNRELLEDRFGWLQGWGRSGDACGYYPGSQGNGSPLTGRFKEGGVDYWSPSGYLYIAEWADRPTFIEGEMRAAPPEA